MKASKLFCLSAVLSCAVASSLDAAELKWQSTEIVGAEWMLHSGGVSWDDAFAGHGGEAGPEGVFGSGARSEFQASWDIDGVSNGEPPFAVNLPVQSELPELHWLEGLSTFGSSYDSTLSVVSGFPPPPVMFRNWTFRVLPTGDETLGMPVSVGIDASFQATLTASGSGVAEASWFVSTDPGGVILGGVMGLDHPGSQSIDEQGADDLLLSIGDTFELGFAYDLSVTGQGQSFSRAEITQSRIGITVTVVPEPASLSLLALGTAIAAFRRRR